MAARRKQRYEEEQREIAAQQRARRERLRLQAYEDEQLRVRAAVPPLRAPSVAAAHALTVGSAPGMCGECGADLMGSRFCTSCGARASAPGAHAQPPRRLPGEIGPGGSAVLSDDGDVDLILSDDDEGDYADV